MNVALNTNLDLEQLQRDAEAAQGVVLTIVDREEELKKRMEEFEVLEKKDRLELAAQLILECDSLVEVHKILKEQVNKVQKRIEALSTKVQVETMKEVKGGGKEKKEEYETESFQLKIKTNPPSVQVDDIDKLPKQWRTAPPPAPHWKKWAPDKNAIKKALKNQEKKSIPGVSLAYKEALVITRK